MKIRNNSKKIISIGSTVLMPEGEITVNISMKDLPSVKAMEARGHLVLDDSEERIAAALAEKKAAEAQKAAEIAKAVEEATAAAKAETTAAPAAPKKAAAKKSAAKQEKTAQPDSLEKAAAEPVAG